MSISAIDDYKAALQDERSESRRWNTAGTARAGEGVVIISNDGHVSPTYEVLRSYCPKEYLGEFDAYAKAWAEAMKEGWFNDNPAVKQGRAIEIMDPDYAEALRELHSDEKMFYDPLYRLRHLDDDGVTAEVIYHGVGVATDGLPFVTGGFSRVADGVVCEPLSESERDRELAAAGLRIYNRWLSDYCSAAPGRYLGLAQLPMWDIDLAVREVEFAAESGLQGVNFPAPRRTLPDYNRLLWDPLWSVCADLQMPLNGHAGAVGSINTVAAYDGEIGSLQCLFNDLSYFSRRAVPFLVFGAVFERHPELYLLLTEQSTSWLPQMVSDLDVSVDFARGYRLADLTMKPSEYFYRNVFVGASFMSNKEAHTAMANGSAHNLVWGRDYPHPEGTWPYTKWSIRRAMEGIPADIAREMLGTNAVRIFGLDPAETQAIADKLGPTIEEVLTPLPPAELPSGGKKFTAGFRDAERGPF